MQKEIRSFFAQFFTQNNNKITEQTQLQQVSNTTPYYFKPVSNAYDTDIVRSCINAIASNVAKLNVKHVKGGFSNSQSIYDKLLGLRPNPYMSSYDFIYKLISLLYTTNNAFVYINRDSNYNVIGFYPVDYSNIQLLQDSIGTLYYKFQFINGQAVTCKSEQLIHIRRHFNKHDLFGDEALNPLLPTLSLINNSYEAIKYAIQNSGQIDGIIKTTSMIADDSLKNIQKNFINSYKNLQNHGGIAVLDSKADYIQLNKSAFEKVDEKTLSFARNQIFRYFNISEKIINSNYSEQEYNSFYNSVVEPLAIQLSQEFTSKLFTSKEISFGNEIKFSSDRMLFASQQTKLQIIRDLLPFGVINRNQAREILELSPIDDPTADEYVISLNYTQTQHLNEYQGVGNSTIANNTDNINKDNPNDTEDKTINE
jgi:HK97 family phage portal protein